MAVEGARLKDLRMIGAVHALRTAYFVRKDTPMKTIADLKGKRVAFGLFRHAQHRHGVARDAGDGRA